MDVATRESGCLRMQPKVGGKLHLRLNTTERPIVNKYREGKLKRTLKREFNSTRNRIEVKRWTLEVLRYRVIHVWLRHSLRAKLCRKVLLACGFCWRSWIAFHFVHKGVATIRVFKSVVRISSEVVHGCACVAILRDGLIQ